MKALVVVFLVLCVGAWLVWEYFNWRRVRRRKAEIAEQKKLASPAISSPTSGAAEEPVSSKVRQIPPGVSGVARQRGDGKKAIFSLYYLLVEMENAGVLENDEVVIQALQERVKGGVGVTKYFAERGEHLLSVAPWVRSISLLDSGDFQVVKEVMMAIPGVIGVRKGRGPWKRTPEEEREDTRIRQLFAEKPPSTDLWARD